jgi:hypothetical protein
MPFIKLEIKNCRECPNFKTGNRWSSDGFDRMEDWLCTKCDGKKIQGAVEWHEESKIEIPEWCPILIPGLRTADEVDADAKSFAQTAVEDINAAWMEFGRYNYFDKGPEDVLELSKYHKILSPLEGADAGAYLQAVLDTRHEGSVSFVDACLGSLDHVKDEDWWEACVTVGEVGDRY